MSPVADLQLLRVALEAIEPHPLNANLMSAERLEKLERNIGREGKYPPLVARPHPDGSERWELLDGHQRLEVLRRLGHTQVVIFPWPCDDQTALLLLSTLNRLSGEDVPARRAQLLADLEQLLPAPELALLVPESASEIEELLGLLDLDTDRLLADLERQASERPPASTRLISFAVPAECEDEVEAVVTRIIDGLEGANRRGLALVQLCRAYTEGSDGASTRER